MGLSLDESFQAQTNTKLLKQFLLRMLKLYLIWTIIYFPLAIWGYYLEGTTIVKAIKTYILNFLFVGEHYNSWPLWYLLSSIWTTVFLLIMHRSREISFSKLVQYGILISIISFSLNIFMYADNDNLIFTEYLIKAVVFETIKNGRIMVGAIYIPFGLYISKNKINIRIYLVLLILGATLGICWDNSFLRSYSTMLSAIGLFGCSIYFNVAHSYFIEKLRKMSTWIYFIHMYVYTGIYLVLYNKKTTGMMPFVLTAFLSSCISVILDKVVKEKWKRVLV